MNTLHANFNGGLMTPLMGSRFDTEKLRTGCKTLKNMIPSVYGGAFKRPGTQYLGSTKDDGEARLHGFKRSIDVNYMLEFGDEYLRFWKSSVVLATQVSLSSATAWQTSTAYAVGDYVDQSSTIYYCIEAHTSGTFATDLAASKWVAQTILELPTPYDKDDVFDLQFCQLNDVLFIAHPDYEPRRLTRTSETSWALEVVPWQFAPVLDVNDTAKAIQLQYNEDDWATSTSYSVGDRVVNDGQLYSCFSAHTSGASTEPGTGGSWETAWNVGTSSENISDWATATSYTSGDKVKSNGVLYLCTANHTSKATVFTRGGSTQGNQPGSGFLWVNYWSVYGGAYDLAGMSFKLAASEALFASTDVDTTWQINIGAAGRYVSLSTTTTGESDWIFIQGAFSLSTKWSTGNGLVGSIVLDESLNNVTSQVVRQWASEANDGNISYEGEAPDTGAWYRVRVFNTSGGQHNATLQASESVLKFPFAVDSYTDSKTVLGRLLTPNDQSPPSEVVGSSTTSYHKPAFVSTQGFPKAVGFHDGRLWWAGTEKQGSRLWASKVDDFYNYLLGANDDSALDLSLAATEANQIQWIASHNRALVVGTSSQEWTIDGGDSETVITPSNRRARMRTKHGSLGLPPEIIAESLLWITRQGTKLREFTYQFQTDGFTAPDMTALLGTLEDGVQQTAYQAVPVPTMWFITRGTTGELWGFSYDREQQVTAWHQHTTGEDDSDSFESVATMYGNSAVNTDETWFVVKRVINGVTKRYVERFRGGYGVTWWNHMEDDYARFEFGDCWSYDGVGPTLTNDGADCDFTGASWLAARDVVAFNGSNEIGSGSVSTSGTGTISDFNKLVGLFGTAIGLPFDSEIESFALEVGLQDGTGQGREWRTSRVELILHDALGGRVGVTSDAIHPIEYPTTAVANTPFRGRAENHLEADWGSTTQLYIKHSDPTPFGLLGYILKSEVSGK